MRALDQGEAGIPRRAVALRWRLFPPAGCDLDGAWRRWCDAQKDGGRENLHGIDSMTSLRTEAGSVLVEVSLRAKALVRPAELALWFFGAPASRIIKESLIFGEQGHR